jgi:hypothetical protein
MTVAMKKSLAISIQLAILSILAVLGIIYILNTSPVEKVENYQKQEMPKPYVRRTDNSFFSPSKSNTNDSDAVSLMGTSGKYDEVRIGRSYEED